MMNSVSACIESILNFSTFVNSQSCTNSIVRRLTLFFLDPDSGFRIYEQPTTAVPVEMHEYKEIRDFVVREEEQINVGMADEQLYVVIEEEVFEAVSQE